MSFGIYLPVAGNSVNVLLLVGLGGLVGLLSGPPTVAAASDSNQIVAASTSATFAHARAGTVDFKMGVLMLLGGILGGTLGVRLIQLLRAAGEADFVIIVTYVVMLGGIGSYMLHDSLRGLRRQRIGAPAEVSPKRPSRHARFVNALPWQTDFRRSGVRVSALMPFVLGALVGVLAAIMGVGGGFIMVPVMVYLLRMPMHVVVGTSLFQILFTCSNVMIMQAWMNRTVDVVLALLLLLGSVIGAQIGARIRVRATTPAGDDLAIRIAGASEDVKLKRKGRRLGLVWMNVGEVHYQAVPSVHLLRSTRPLGEIAARDLLERLGLGLDALRDRAAPAAGEARDLFGELVQLKERDHLYSVQVGGIDVTVRDDGAQEASCVIRLPAKAPVGDYEVEVFSFPAGEGERLGSATIRLERGPAVEFVTTLVARHGLLYGCLAVVIAVLAGLLTGFVFSKGKGGAH